jgi:tetratricopeptide (TPR) repeat protein
MIRWLRTLHALVTLARSFRSALASGPPPRAGAPAVGELLERAAAARSGGRSDEARALFEEALRAHPGGGEPLAIVHYELARLEAERGRTAAAVAHFKSALRADRGFVPAAVALGDAQEHTGDLREAVRTWERAAEVRPTLALLGRLERVYRNEGRPSRMIALYRGAAERASEDLSLAVGLGRVYFELEMLDEAADQFEKIEVRAPEMPIVHAFLGAIFERRGETREAFEEYRRALRLAGAFDWPYRCAACGAAGAAWEDRCPRCLRVNALRPVGPRDRRESP